MRRADAAAIGALGAAFGAVALAASSTTAENPWHDATAIPVCGVLVQVLAVLVGTGLGLLVGNRVIAFVETLVVPLALWLVLRPFHLENWLSPLGAQANLQGGSPSGLEWVQWAVVFVLWGVGLNAYGTMRRNRNG